MPTRPSDPLFKTQWHLVDGGLTSVWDDYTGRGVTVLVADDGIESDHPDLVANIDPALQLNLSTGERDGNPVLADDFHGTTMAGIIAASRNGKGGVGVAYGATLGSAKYTVTVDPADMHLERAFQLALRADVMNNSWGFLPFQDDFDDPAFARIAAAMDEAAAKGRGGLGTVMVFSAGNEREYGFDAGLTAINSSPLGIQVAAARSDGSVADYSTPGASILVAAPGGSEHSGVVTTDRTGRDGISPGDYTRPGDGAGGTSVSAAYVSGVVALMLEANPNLGYRDVQEILAYSAVPEDVPFRTWQPNQATNWNGGGLATGRDQGFGLVDPLAAVRLAESWTDRHTAANLRTATASAAPDAVISDEIGTTTSTVRIKEALQVDHVQVTLHLTHTYFSDLTIELTSPGGTTSRLVSDFAREILYPLPTTLTWTFTSTQFWGENSVGTWVLEVSDFIRLDSGRLIDWSLDVLGDPQPKNDTYIFTDALESLDDLFERRRIDDTDGGVDTINAAARTSRVELDLAPLSPFASGGGLAWTYEGTLIENAIGGDAGDEIFGNHARNQLRGGRGDDLLDGRIGSDMLFGGDGDDTLWGNDRQYGRIGVDTLAGGDGDDVIHIDHRRDVLIEAEGGGNDTLVTPFNTNLLDLVGIENLELIGNARVATGDAGANHIRGNQRSNVIDGGAGADTMEGGGGDDIFYVDDPGDVVRGGSKAISSVDYTADIWKLVLVGGALNGTGGRGSNQISGNAGRNRLDGHAGNDTLVGAVGADTLIGGSGNDTADYKASTVGVGVNLTTGNAIRGDAAGDRLSEIESLVGSKFADTLTGSAADNRLDGGAGDDRLKSGDGDDTLIGGSGADRMEGGAGDDLYHIDKVGDLVVEAANAGIDTVETRIDLVLGSNLENLKTYDEYGTALDIDGIGNELDNHMSGNYGINRFDGGAGNDTLEGSVGDDTLIGGSGADYMDGGRDADTYYVDNAADFVQEDWSILGGIDTVVSSIGYVLAERLENLTLTGTLNLKGTGNALQNVILGNEGGNVLTGYGGDDRLTGNGGNDVLIGGAGVDVLSGGAGRDRFVFVSGSSVDRIVDFDVGRGDVIDIRSNTYIDSFADVLARTTQTNDVCYIDLGGGDRLALLSVSKADLTAADFLI